MLKIKILEDTRLYPTAVNVRQDNSNVDKFVYTMSNYIVNEHNLSTYDWYAVLLGVNGIDEVILTSEIVDNELQITFDLSKYVTRIGDTIKYQLVAKDSLGTVWHSSEGIIKNAESIKGDEYIVGHSSSFLKEWEDRMKNLKDDTLEEINEIASDFGAAIIYIPYGEEIQDKVYNRLYYRWLDEENTIGQFEDHTGKVLTPDMVAENIGVSAIAGVNGSNVQEVLASLQHNIDTKDYLPDQSGHQFKVLKTDGEKAYWDYSTGGLPLLTCLWSDHFLKDVSYLRADTFSWHSGDIYVSAYNELVNEYNDVNSIEEIEGDITYKRTPSGYKICLPDQELNVANAYDTTGIAWFYILDTENKQFKLPRTKFGFVGLRNGVGNYVNETLPNITGSATIAGGLNQMQVYNTTGCFTYTESGDAVTSIQGHSGSPYNKGLTLNANLSNPVYQDNASVQQKATQMYLYFYVGNSVRKKTEIDVGKLSEKINDLDINVISQEVDTIKTTAINEIETTKSTVISEIEATGVDSLQSQITELEEELLILKKEMQTMLGRMDFANSETVSLKSSETYTCPSDGYIQFVGVGQTSNQCITMNGVNFCSYTAISNGTINLVPVTQGDVVGASSLSAVVNILFIPQKTN